MNDESPNQVSLKNGAMDYNKKGFVTAFIGHFPDLLALNRYVRISYEDDDPSSPLQEDFMIGGYEPDFREVEFFENARSSASEFLKGASYWKSFIDTFATKYDAIKDQCPNSVILIYDLDFPIEARHELLEGKAWLLGLGSFSYDKSSAPI